MKQGKDGKWRKVVSFNDIKLGLMAQGCPAGQGGGIKIIYIPKDGPAHQAGCRVGDMIASVNGKPIESVMKDVTSTDEFCTLVKSLQRPLTLELHSTSFDNTVNVHEQNILINAGQMYKREVNVEKGQVLRLKFWIAEAQLDIGFAIEEQGQKNLVYPHVSVWNENSPCGPTSFTAKRDGKLVLVWNNGHSWLRANT